MRCAAWGIDRCQPDPAVSREQETFLHAHRDALEALRRWGQEAWVGLAHIKVICMARAFDHGVNEMSASVIQGSLRILRVDDMGIHHV